MNSEGLRPVLTMVQIEEIEERGIVHRRSRKIIRNRQSKNGPTLSVTELSSPVWRNRARNDRLNTWRAFEPVPGLTGALRN